MDHPATAAMNLQLNREVSTGLHRVAERTVEIGHRRQEPRQRLVVSQNVTIRFLESAGH
jgi:hypothetical protein